MVKAIDAAGLPWQLAVQGPAQASWLGSCCRSIIVKETENTQVVDKRAIRSSNHLANNLNVTGNAMNLDRIDNAETSVLGIFRQEGVHVYFRLHAAFFPPRETGRFSLWNN